MEYAVKFSISGGRASRYANGPTFSNILNDPIYRGPNLFLSKSALRPLSGIFLRTPCFPLHTLKVFDVSLRMIFVCFGLSLSSFLSSRSSLSYPEPDQAPIASDLLLISNRLGTYTSYHIKLQRVVFQ